VRGLTGATLGGLLPLAGGRLLAAIGTERGVWVAQLGGGARSAATHRLTDLGARPGALAMTSLRRGGTAVAWTATSFAGAEPGPRRIYLAIGSRLRAPGGAHVAITVPTGHQVDELGLAAGRSAPRGAWIESWFDRHGVYRSRPVLADLARGSKAMPLGAAGELASGLSFTANAHGDQLLAWRACSRAGSCAVRAAVRSAGGRLGPARRIGLIDPSQQPVAAIAPDGESLVGWIAGGHPMIAERSPGANRFGAGRAISSTVFAADLALAFGPAGRAIAAWTQGTVAQSLVAAVYRSH
jgi:hypothetical protein